MWYTNEEEEEEEEEEEKEEEEDDKEEKDETSGACKRGCNDHANVNAFCESKSDGEN